MTEWDLQVVLTRKWAENGLLINGKLHLLAAWEVMTPSWRINDHLLHWNEPSLDFLVVDSTLQFTVIELKTEVPGIKPAWRTLCQVTHRAAKVSATLSLSNLEKAHSACWSGKHGRVPTSVPPSFSSHFKSFFGTDLESIEWPRDVQRCVAAVEFGPSWPDALAEFNRLPIELLQKRVCEMLTSENSQLELNRFIEICKDERYLPSQPVIMLPIG